ncbi:unnamed protein product [Candidula unifasciata]|uniref:Uncharacterized protein n=1 Tax=Candidula unifasciata TaxID=100452 RepID=A0A8S3YDU3_9EUPU|nr:unnamed protein product [Candidula unifasciata]
MLSCPCHVCEVWSRLALQPAEKLNTTVFSEDKSNTTVFTEDESNTTVWADHGSTTSYSTDIFTSQTVITIDGSTNTTTTKETDYFTTPASSLTSQSTTIKVDYSVDCSKYAIESTAKPAVQLKVEPLCTESGSILDQLTRFIGYQFPKHKCGNPNSTAKFAEILYCSMLNTHTLCMQPFVEELQYINTETVPQIKTVRNIIGALCSMDRFIAKDCLFKRLKYVTRCVKAEVDSILSFQNKRWAYGVIDQCRHLELKVMCMWENVLPCNVRTAASMAGLIGQHLRPDTCTLSASQPILSMNWFQLTAISCAQVLLFVMGNT